MAGMYETMLVDAVEQRGLDMGYARTTIDKAVAIARDQGPKAVVYGGRKYMLGVAQKDADKIFDMVITAR